MRALIVLAVLTARARADDDRGLPPGGSAAEGRRGVIDWEAKRCGLVVEASAGGGMMHFGPWGIIFSIFTQSENIATFERPSLGGAVGIGGWITSRVALTGRMIGTGYVDPTDDRRSITALFGPNLQYWLPPLSGAFSGRPSLWLGGGVGVAMLASGERAYGVGGDARAGYASGPFQIALEATESIFHFKYDTITLMLTIGYQNL